MTIFICTVSVFAIVSLIAWVFQPYAGLPGEQVSKALKKRKGIK